MVAECLTETADARQAAAGYISRGWQPVPLPAGSKAPTRPGWQRGGFTASDFDPTGNVGLLLGDASGGLVDVDLDCPESLDLAGDYLPPTGWTFGRESKPRSHWLYIIEGDAGRTRRWTGADGECLVELRANGGQTMAPPSVHPSGERVRDDASGEPARVSRQELEAACDALAKAADGPETTTDNLRPLYEYLPTADAIDTDRQRRYAQAALDGELAKVRAAGEGSRNVTLNAAAMKVGHFVGAGLLTEADVQAALLNAARDCGLPEREAAATIQSGLTAGKAEPWQDREASLPASGGAVVRDTPQERPLSPYIDAADFLADPLFLADPVIDGLLRRGETGTLVSSSKARKSWTAQELCVAVASGGRWFGLDCRRGRVLLIDCELQAATLQHRLASVVRAMGLSVADLRGRMSLATWRGETVTLGRLASFLDAIAPGEFDLIVADPIYKLYPKGFDENSNAAMAELFGSFQALAERVQAALLLVAHSPKGDTSERATIDLVSGAGSAGRAVDVAIALRAHEASETDQPVIVRETIARSFPAIAPACFRLEHPLWVPAPDLDPADLKRSGSRRRKPKAPEVERPEDEPADFAQRFIGVEPRTCAAIVDAAMQSGLTERKGKSLLKRAEARGLIHRWTDRNPNQPARFANVEQPESEPDGRSS